MFFYLHYMLMTSGLSGTSVLLGVYYNNYTDASQGEIGVLMMTFPFVSLIIKPLFCSMADRKQAHKKVMIWALVVELIGFSVYAILPFFPDFYSKHPRIAWYILVVACHVGLGGLGVSWSLGDCLAVNMSQKSGTHFGRMRLMGTISWGFYGFVIGQINEVYFLPKYVPAFFILLASLVIEITLIFCWNNEDFEMVDPLQQQQLEIKAMDDQAAVTTSCEELCSQQMNNFVDSAPSSLGGTLRLDSRTSSVLRDMLTKDHECIQKKLSNMIALQQSKGNVKASNDQEVIAKRNDRLEQKKCEADKDLENPKVEFSDENRANRDKNPQMILLKLILMADGRLLKYILLFTIYGSMLSPLNFIFISMEGVCREKGCNFSQLAGAVLISQAAIETVAFLIIPFILCYISRSILLSSGFLMLGIRFFFYSGWYYTADISPYWSVIAEWAHGFAYGIFCIIQADVSLMFANESRLFIPELRRLGFLSDERTTSKAKIEAEERSIKMALRATIQALFSGFMDGLGQGMGALICGIFIELYSYIILWKMYWIVVVVTIILHQLIELSRSRWSDTFRAKKGTKAYEIMQLTEAMDCQQQVVNDKK